VPAFVVAPIVERDHKHGLSTSDTSASVYIS
jgi:LytS/YehU family sensor histidine kinase